MSLDLLVGVLNGRPTRLPSSHPEWLELIEFARLQGVGPVLAHALHSSPDHTQGLGDFRAPLRSLLVRSTQRALLLQRALVELTGAFQAAGLSRPVALKGIHLAATVYASPGLRTMSDLDILVPVHDARRAMDAAREIGFTSTSVGDPDPHHLPPLTRGPVRLEIHWLLIPPTLPGRPSSAADMTSILGRTESFMLQQFQCEGLCPDDLLLHLCAHSAHHHLFEHRLRAVWDVGLVLRHYRDRLNWIAIAERARRWGVCRGVAITLAVVKRLDIEPIPSERIAQFEPTGVPAEAIAAAIGQLERPAVSTKVSPHVSRLWAMGLSPRERIVHLLQRAFLLEFGEDPLQPAGLIRSWTRRLTRPFRVASTYLRRLWSMDSKELAEVAAMTRRRNQLEQWLTGD